MAAVEYRERQEVEHREVATEHHQKEQQLGEPAAGGRSGLLGNGDDATDVRGGNLPGEERVQEAINLRERVARVGPGKLHRFAERFGFALDGVVVEGKPATRIKEFGRGARRDFDGLAAFELELHLGVRRSAMEHGENGIGPIGLVGLFRELDRDGLEYLRLQVYL